MAETHREQRKGDRVSRQQTCSLNPGKPCLQVKVNKHHTNREPRDESLASHSFGICPDARTRLTPNPRQPSGLCRNTALMINQGSGTQKERREKLFDPYAKGRFNIWSLPQATPSWEGGKRPLPGLTPINGEWKYKLFNQQPRERRPSPPNTQRLQADKSLIAAVGRERRALPAHSRAEHPPRHLPLRTSCLFNHLPESGTFPGPGNTSSLRGGKARAFPAPQQGSHQSPSPALCRMFFSPRAPEHLCFPAVFLAGNEPRASVPRPHHAWLCWVIPQNNPWNCSRLGWAGLWWVPSLPTAGGWNSIFKVRTNPNGLIRIL